jgi:hypothetical protein
MYRETQKQKILAYLKNHTAQETCKKFDVKPDTLKYWQDPDYRQSIQTKEKNKYQPVGETKRTYTRGGNREAQRIDAQIKRAMNKVPRIKYSDAEIQSELEKISTKQGSVEATAANNKAILTHQQHFYDKEREMFADPKIARRIIKNRSKYLDKEPKDLTPQEILRGFKISGEYYGYSHFAPEWFKWFVEQTGCKSVLDPCGGWGHRLVGTIGSTIDRYIYNDFDPRTYQGCKDLAEKWKDCFSCDLIFFNERAELLDVSGLAYDSIFTCPPYFNKEKYNDKTFRDIDDFASWWNNVISNIIKDSVKNIGIVIDEQNIDVVSSPCLDHGYKLEQKIPIKVKKSHFTTNSVKDVMLVFRNKKD